jgi:hypothetical protein
MFMLFNNKTGSPLGITTTVITGRSIEFIVSDCVFNSGSQVSCLLVSADKEVLLSILTNEMYSFKLNIADIVIREFTSLQTRQVQI